MTTFIFALANMKNEEDACVEKRWEISTSTTDEEIRGMIEVAKTDGYFLEIEEIPEDCDVRRHIEDKLTRIAIEMGFMSITGDWDDVWSKYNILEVNGLLRVIGNEEEMRYELAKIIEGVKRVDKFYYSYKWSKDKESSDC